MPISQSPPTIAAKSIESYFVKESHLSISLSRILAQFLTLLCRRSQQASRRTRSIHSGLQCKFHMFCLISLIFWFLFDRFFSSLSQHSFQFLYFQILSFLANCSRPSFTLSSSLQLMALLSTQPDLYTQTHSNQMWPSNSQSLDLNWKIRIFVNVKILVLYFTTASSLFLSVAQIYQHWAVSINMSTSCFLAIRLKQTQKQHHHHLKMPREGNVLASLVTDVVIRNVTTIISWSS